MSFGPLGAAQLTLPVIPDKYKPGYILSKAGNQREIVAHLYLRCLIDDDVAEWHSGGEPTLGNLRMRKHAQSA